MKNAGPVRLLEALGNLAGDAKKLLLRETRSTGSADTIGQRLALDVLQDQVVSANVVDLADMRMIERGDRARFLLEPSAMLLGEPFHRDDTIEPRVACFPHFSHAAAAQEGQDFIGAEPRTRSQ